MIRVRVGVMSHCGRIPRESGDDPGNLHRSARAHIVFPARAGMIRTFKFTIIRSISIPRESGDDPSPRDSFTLLSKYSPRERG